MPGVWYKIKHQGCVPSWAVSSVFILRALCVKCARGALFFSCSKRCVNGAVRVVQESSSVSSAGVELSAGTNANRVLYFWHLLPPKLRKSVPPFYRSCADLFFPLHLLFPKVLFKIGFPGRKR